MDIPQIRVTLSSVSGSVSIACWIVLLLPQLVEQWKTKSADGIAIMFLFIWFLGDVTNLVGALWAGLLPDIILLAVWYCFADALLLSSYFYYKRLARLEREALQSHVEGENAAASDPTQPLLNRRNSASTGNQRKSSSSRRRRDSLSEIVENDDKSSVWTRYILPILFVVGAGVFGYFASGKKDGGHEDPSSDLDFWPQLLGYTSAFLYLGARIPQIIQNHKRRSVYGLSLLFFILSTLGNITYAGSILIYRNDSAWVMLNLSWILGSLGTVVEDAVIFAQFYIYKNSGSAVEE